MDDKYGPVFIGKAYIIGLEDVKHAFRYQYGDNDPRVSIILCIGYNNQEGMEMEQCVTIVMGGADASAFWVVYQNWVRSVAEPEPPNLGVLDEPFWGLPDTNP